MDAASRYAAHVAHLTEACSAAAASAGVDVLVLHAGSPALRDRFDDQHHNLRPTPAFAHWVPLAEPDAVLVIAPDRKPRLMRPKIEDFWEAPPAPPPDWVLAPFDVEELPAGQAPQLPAGRRAVVSSAPPAWAGDAVNPPALVAALDQVRVRKTEHERACLAEASRIAVRGHRRAIADFLADDCSELELHLAYLAATGQDDVDTPYKNIVALGEHAAVLHFITYDRARTGKPTQSLLVDAGAMHLGYGSDITRTTVRGPGADLFAALIAKIEAFQQRLIGEIRPGLAYEELHDRSHHYLAEALVDLRIGRGSAEALVNGGITRALYPHGLGHGLGIQVHDVGQKLTPPRADNPYLRNTSVIAEGQVFTIEPGCYFIDALLAPLRSSELLDWKLVDGLRRFGGIRIENDVAVVEGGLRDFTREAFDEAERSV